MNVKVYLIAPIGLVCVADIYVAGYYQPDNANQFAMVWKNRMGTVFGPPNG